MFTQPMDLPDSRVLRVLQSAWSLTVDTLEYAPVGFGSHHWLAKASDLNWFVTVDSITGENDAGQHLSRALSTARLLCDLGLDFVVAPVPTARGDVLAPIGDGYVAALYPYIEGQSHGWGPFGDSGSRGAVLDRLVALHTCQHQARRHAAIDGFGVPCRTRLEEALAEVSRPWRGGPFAEPARHLLTRLAKPIGERLQAYDRLVDAVADRPDRFVVTHGEPHRGNIIMTTTGVVLVDWDTALLAPPERDLWWLTREDAAILDEYELRTGTAVDLGAIDLYRLRWDLTDVALFTVDLRGRHRDTEDTRTAWDALVVALDRIEQYESWN